MRAGTRQSMRQYGMKRSFLLGCGFVAASVVLAACSELTGPKSPETPINVTATLQAGNLVQVTWARSPQSDGVVSYNILRNGTKVGEATTLSFIDSGLGEKATYKYTVSANCTNALVAPARCALIPAMTTGRLALPSMVLVT